jgi:hypothetical protein
MLFRLCNALASFQWCMMSIFSEMIEKIIEVFMDDFTVYGKTFNDCLESLDKVLQWCEEEHLVLNWEKCHLLVINQLAIPVDLEPSPEEQSCLIVVWYLRLLFVLICYVIKHCLLILSLICSHMCDSTS